MNRVLSNEELRMLLLPSECESIEKQLLRHGNNIRLRNSTCMKLLFNIKLLRERNEEAKFAVGHLTEQLAIANQDIEQIHELNSKLIEEKSAIENRHFTLDDLNNAYLAGQETSDVFESWLRYYTSEARG